MQNCVSFKIIGHKGAFYRKFNNKILENTEK